MIAQKRLKFFQEGKAWEGFECGCVSYNQYVMWLRFNLYKEFLLKGNKSSEAVHLAANQMKCSTDSIHRAIRFFTSD